MVKTIPFDWSKADECYELPPDIIEVGDKVERGCPPCGVKSFTATPAAFTPNQLQAGAGGIVYVKTARRTLEFKITMCNPADANTVQVIQYYKNESFKTNQGTAIATPGPGPKNTTWKWAAGTDGWIVDSQDDDRCWPQNPPENRGLKRDATLGTVEWNDTPGVTLTAVNTDITSGALGQNDFPLSYSLDFKTDVLCCSQQVCGKESAANRTAMQAAWSSCVVASVAWSFSVKIHIAQSAKGLVAVCKQNAGEPSITGIAVTILKSCP